MAKKNIPTDASADAQSNLVDSIFDHGALIDLDLGTWTGQAKLEKEVLGLDSIPKDLMTLGRKRLVRKNLAQRPMNVVAKAHQYINERSHSFPMSRARFIIYERFDEIINKLKEYKSEFDESVNAVIDEYDAERETMLRTWRVELTKHFGNRIDYDLEQALIRVEASYPDIAYIRRAYRFQWNLFNISVPPDIELKVANFKAREEMEKSIEGFVGECVGTLKDKVTDLVAHVNKLLDSKEEVLTFSTASKKSINKNIETIRSLNFFDDDGIEQAIKNLGDSVNNPFCTRKAIAEAADKAIGVIQEDVQKATTRAVDSLTGGVVRKIRVR